VRSRGAISSPFDFAMGARRCGVVYPGDFLRPLLAPIHKEKLPHFHEVMASSQLSRLRRNRRCIGRNVYCSLALMGNLTNFTFDGILRQTPYDINIAENVWGQRVQNPIETLSFDAIHPPIATKLPQVPPQVLVLGCHTI
jgi:hypothetical protein